MLLFPQAPTARLSTRLARGTRASLACLPALLLAACGGGGGGEAAAPDASAPPAVQAVSINATNQKSVAADALDSATNVSAGTTGASLVTGAQVQGDPGATVGSPAQLAAAARKLTAMAPALASTATGVSVNESAPCDLGGTISITGEVAGGNALVAGDTLTITAANCKAMVEGVATTMNGSMTMRVVSGTYRTDVKAYPSQIVMSITARSLSMSGNGVTNLSNGDLQIDLREQDFFTANMALSGAELTNSVTTSAGTRSGTLKNYRQSLAVTDVTVANSVTAAVEATNGRLGTVAYQVDTPAPLVIQKDGDFQSGSLKIVGNKSALLITVTAENTFKLELDADGDGTYESSTTATLADLKALL